MLSHISKNKNKKLFVQLNYVSVNLSKRKKLSRTTKFDVKHKLIWKITKYRVENVENSSSFYYVRKRNKNSLMSKNPFEDGKKS